MEQGGSRKSDDRPISEQTGSELTSGGVAFAFPVVGVGYFRTRESRLEPATAGGRSGRENEGTARVGRSLLLHQFGLSLAHSLGDAVVLGATVRVMRGELSTLNPAGGPPDEVFDALGEIDGPTAGGGGPRPRRPRAPVASACGVGHAEPDHAIVFGVGRQRRLGAGASGSARHGHRLRCRRWPDATTGSWRSTRPSSREHAAR